MTYAAFPAFDDETVPVPLDWEAIEEAAMESEDPLMHQWFIDHDDPQLLGCLCMNESVPLDTVASLLKEQEVYFDSAVYFTDERLLQVCNLLPSDDMTFGFRFGDDLLRLL